MSKYARLPRKALLAGLLLMVLTVPIGSRSTDADEDARAKDRTVLVRLPADRVDDLADWVRDAGGHVHDMDTLEVVHGRRVDPKLAARLADVRTLATGLFSALEPMREEKKLQLHRFDVRGSRASLSLSLADMSDLMALRSAIWQQADATGHRPGSVKLGAVTRMRDGRYRLELELGLQPREGPLPGERLPADIDGSAALLQVGAALHEADLQLAHAGPPRILDLPQSGLHLEYREIRTGQATKAKLTQLLRSLGELPGVRVLEIKAVVGSPRANASEAWTLSGGVSLRIGWLMGAEK